MANNGLLTIDGKSYTERLQIFPVELTVAASNIYINRLVLPGVANFLLKGLTRDTVVAGASSVKRFKFRLGNSDGATYYTSGGVGGTTDRVIDSLMFGNGQFPYPITSPIFYSASANIVWEVEDISAAAYTLYMAFHGSYLIPTGV